MKSIKKCLNAEDFFQLLTSTLSDNTEPLTLSSVNDLIAFDQSAEPTVVILDNAHQLFLSEVGCFDAYRALLSCLNAHLHQIFWVITMHHGSWSYINQVFAREQQFTQIYRMQKWSAFEIRRLIMSRHDQSNRRILFNELLFSANATSESSSIRSAEARVFNILWEQSEGNPQTALALWLKATRLQGFAIQVGVPQTPYSAQLSQLSDELFFVYAAIWTHRSLGSKEIISVTHLSDAIVRNALKQGVNIGVLVRGNDRRYEISALWLAPMYALLQSKNMVIAA